MAADLTKNPDDFELYGTFTDEVELDPESEEEMDDYDYQEDNFDSFEDEEALSLPINSIQAIKSLNQELVNLRKEIQSLKNEIKAVSGTNKHDETPGIIPEEAAEETAETRGFFDDEDEDSITLTFDELDSLDELVEEEIDNPFAPINTEEIIDNEIEDIDLEHAKILPEDELQSTDILDDTILSDSSLFQEDPAFETLSSEDEDEFYQEIPGIDTSKVEELSENEITRLRDEKNNKRNEFHDTPPEEDIVISKDNFPGNDSFTNEGITIDEENINITDSHDDFDNMENDLDLDIEDVDEQAFTDEIDTHDDMDEDVDKQVFTDEITALDDVDEDVDKQVFSEGIDEQAFTNEFFS